MRVIGFAFDPPVPRNAPPLESFLVSTGLVALAEIGDKTQLLAFILAARFRKPVPIIFGILVATILNHALAGAAGAAVAALLGPEAVRWILGLAFLAIAVWVLVPDSDENLKAKNARFGAFGATLIAFFLAEMGDKTQIATVALAARFESLTAVVAGTTLGMMIANVPAVYLGERTAHLAPVRLVHAVAAAIFAVLGILTLLGVGAAAYTL